MANRFSERNRLVNGYLRSGGRTLQAVAPRLIVYGAMKDDQKKHARKPMQ
jgi:hypothetical protein